MNLRLGEVPLVIEPAGLRLPLGRRWSQWLAKLKWPLAGEAVAELDYPRCPIRLGVSSAIEYHTRLHACAKEPETIAWIEQQMHAGDSFYDIGANVGVYALVAAARWQGSVRVVACEPSAVNFARLIRNLGLNACGRHVIPVPIALAERAGVEAFHYASLEAGAALHALGEARDYRGTAFTPATSCPVLTFDLDTLVEQFRLPPPTHLKIDVDGAELSVLKGAARTLVGVRSVLIELEVHHPETPAIRAYLKQHGFAETASYPYRFRIEQPAFQGIANVIFQRKETRR